jgi:hypothetical protein
LARPNTASASESLAGRRGGGVELRFVREAFEDFARRARVDRNMPEDTITNLWIITLAIHQRMERSGIRASHCGDRECDPGMLADRFMPRSRQGLKNTYRRAWSRCDRVKDGRRSTAMPVNDFNNAFVRGPVHSRQTRQLPEVLLADVPFDELAQLSR